MVKNLNKTATQASSMSTENNCLVQSLNIEVQKMKSEVQDLTGDRSENFKAQCLDSIDEKFNELKIDSDSKYNLM
jgi:hypothetical protein